MHGLHTAGGLTAISVENNGKSDTLMMWKTLTLQRAATILCTAINIRNSTFRSDSVFSYTSHKQQRLLPKTVLLTGLCNGDEVSSIRSNWISKRYSHDLRSQTINDLRQVRISTSRVTIWNVRSILSNYLQNRKMQAYRKRIGPSEYKLRGSFFLTTLARNILACENYLEFTRDTRKKVQIYVLLCVIVVRF
jgi:hypothetical protein